jgi:hypothetical protein
VWRKNWGRFHSNVFAEPTGTFSRSPHRLESAVQIFPIDKINNLQVVGMQVEKQAIIRTDPLPHHIGHLLEPQRRNQRD